MVALDLKRGCKLTRNFTGVSENRTRILFILFSYPHQASKQLLLWEKKGFPQKKKSFYIILSGIRMPKLHKPSLGRPGKKKSRIFCILVSFHLEKIWKLEIEIFFIIESFHCLAEISIFILWRWTMYVFSSKVG